MKAVTTNNRPGQPHEGAHYEKFGGPSSWTVWYNSQHGPAEIVLIRIESVAVENRGDASWRMI